MWGRRPAPPAWRARPLENWKRGCRSAHGTYAAAAATCRGAAPRQARRPRFFEFRPTDGLRACFIAVSPDIHRIGVAAAPSRRWLDALFPWPAAAFKAELERLAGREAPIDAPCSLNSPHSVDQIVHPPWWLTQESYRELIRRTENSLNDPPLLGGLSPEIKRPPPIRTGNLARPSRAAPGAAPTPNQGGHACIPSKVLVERSV